MALAVNTGLNKIWDNVCSIEQGARGAKHFTVVECTGDIYSFEQLPPDFNLFTRNSAKVKFLHIVFDFLLVGCFAFGIFVLIDMTNNFEELHVNQNPNRPVSGIVLY